MSSSIYKSSEARAALMAFYDAQLRRWPVPYESLTVPTRYGETHIIASGPVDAPPVMLMRGAGGNALLWAPTVAHLSRDFRTYAVDVIGESGKSAPIRPSYRGSAFSDWMVDLLDALKIDRANIAGTSRGGWLTLKIAQLAPQRVLRIVPMCAEGIAPITFRFLAHMLPVLTFPGRRTVTRLLRFLTPPDLPVHQYLVEERLIVYSTFRQSRTRPPLFKDEELRQIRAPALLLYGEQDRVYNLAAVRRRIAHLPGNYRMETVPNAGHVLDFDQTDAVNARITRFLRDGT